MATGKPKFYWDACIFIAWIKDEIRPPGQMEAIAKMAASVDAGQAILMTSVITRTEVLESILTDEQKGRFDAALKRRFIQAIACDMKIADRARVIRDYYKSKQIIMDTPDSIHLATAIIYQANRFLTFDGESKKRRPSRAKLTSLSGNVAGYSLEIAVPYEPPDLLTGIPTIRMIERASSIATAQPPEQSLGDEQPSDSQPEPGRRAVLLDDPEPPQPDSSPDVPPPLPSKK